MARVAMNFRLSLLLVIVLLVIIGGVFGVGRA
jgi:hypothetical protein